MKRPWYRAGLLLGLAIWCGAGPVGAQEPAAPMARLEKQLLERIQQERRRVRLAPLQIDPTLSQAAREHSVDMARLGVATHASQLPDHKTPEDRYQWAFGAAAAKLTENIAVVQAGLAEDAAAGAAALALNGRAEARRNMLDGEVSMIGLGCVEGPDGRIWITALFARPAGQPEPGTPQSVAAVPPGETAGTPVRPPPGPPTIEVTWPDKQRIAEGVWLATPEAGTARIQPCAVFLKITLRGLDPSFVPRLRIDVECSRTFWGLPYYRPENRSYADFEVYVPVVEGPFVMTISAPNAPGCQPVTLRGTRPRPDRPAPPERLGERLGRIQELSQELQGARSENVVRDKHYRIGDELICLACEYIEWSRFSDALPCAVAALQHHEAARAAQDTYDWQFEQSVLADAAFVGGNVELLESGLAAAGGFYLRMPDDKPGGMTKETRLSLAADYYKLAGNCIVTLGGDREMVRGRTAWLKALALEKESALAANRTNFDDRCPAWVKEPGPLPVEAPPPPPVAAPAVAAEPEAPTASADEARAADIRWLRQIEDALATAERRKIEAREKLAGMTLIIRKLEERAALLQSWLDKTPAGESANYLEEFFALAREAWDSATMGPPPEPSQDIRGCLAGQIKRLRQQVGDVRQEQDELIQQTLETYYDTIAQELEARGPQSAGEDVRASARQAIKDVAAIKGLATADLYLAAGEDAKFREAAQACVAEGRYAADARYLEAVYFLGKRDLRQALASFRRVMALTAPAGGEEPPVTTRAEAEALAGKGDNLWQRARQMSWMLEDGYLRAIDAKASAEALRVQGEVTDRLKKGGEEGFLGCMLGYLKVGVFSATSAIMHRDDAVVNLAARYENEVAAQHCGLLLMQSLHERGFPLAAIDGLSNDQFLALMRDYYREAGANLGAEDGVRLRAAVKAALHNPDVNRLVSGSKQELRVDAGRDYFGHDALAETSLESWGDVVNMANVATMLVPMSTYRISGKLAGVRYTGVLGETREAGAVVQTTREGMAAATGLNKLPALLAETRAGRMMMDQAGQFLARSTWTENRALEMTTFLVAGATGEATGGTIGVLAGSDGKTEAEAGRMLAELLTMWTAGDPEAMKEALKAHGLQPEQLAGVAREAEKVAQAAEGVAAVNERDAAALRECLPAEPGAGISAEGRRAAARTKDQIGRELDDIRREIAEGRATPDTLRRVDALELDFKALATAETGAEAEAREWLVFMENRAKEAGGRTAHARAAASEAAEAQSGLPGPNARTGRGAEASAPVETEVPPLPADPKEIKMPSLRAGHPMTKNLDELWINNQHAEALAGYRRWHAVVQHLRLGDSPQVKLAELPQKIGALRRVTEQKAELAQLARSEGIPDHRVEVTRAEVARLDADPNIVKTPIIVNPAQKSYSDPYWVWEVREDRAVKIGVFKGSGEGFRSGPYQGMDLEGEEVYANFGKKFGLNVAACTRCTMTIDGVAREGVFVRMAGGVELEQLGPLAPALFTQPLAEDRVVAALFVEHDRKMGNFLAQDAEQLVSLDHGMADARGMAERDWALGRLQKAEQERVRLERQQAMAEGRSPEGIEAREIHLADVTLDQVTDEDVEYVMRRAVEHWRNRANIKPAGLYRLIDEQITIEKMTAKIRQVQDLFARHPDEARAILRQTYHTETEVEAALQVLTRRARLLDKVLRESFGTIKDLKPIPLKTAAVARPGGHPTTLPAPVIPLTAGRLARAA